MSLRLRLLFAFSILGVGILMMSGVAYYSLTKVSSMYEKLANDSVPKLGDLSGLRNRGRQVHGESLTIVLFSENPDIRKRALASLKKALNRYQEIREEFKGRGFSNADDKSAFDEAEVQWVKVSELANSILKAAESDQPMDIPVALQTLVRLDEAVTSHQKALLALDDVTVAHGEQYSKEAAATETMSIRTVTALAGVTVAIAIFLTIFISRRISMALTRVAGQISDSAREVKQQSQQLQISSESLSSATHEQSAAVTETVAATNQIVAMIQRTAESTSKNLELASESQRYTEAGRDSITRMLRAIDEIKDSSRQMSSQIQISNDELGEISTLMNEIQQKTAVINDIVFQTKLLSFNASVEAARAGEAGKGFAVVAQEMSKLAQTSGNASKEIEGLLQQSGKRVHEIVSKTKSSVDQLIGISEQKVVEGQKTAHALEQSFDVLASRIDQIANMTKEVAQATDEQLAGVAEINSSMQNVGEANETNARSAVECAEAANVSAAEVTKTETAVTALLEVVHGKAA